MFKRKRKNYGCLGWIGILLLIVLAFGSAIASAQVYPSAIADDGDLTVAADGFVTNLDGALNNSATTFDVDAGTGAKNNMVLGIDAEAIFCTTYAANTFSGCTRGFGDTSAAAHSDGAPVTGVIMSEHHNALAEEVKAIETALGVSLANVAAASHTHLEVDITDLSIDWADLTGVPSVFNPASHDHLGDLLKPYDATVYDATATTGQTQFTVKLGAGDDPYADHVFRVLRNDDSLALYMMGDGTVAVRNAVLVAEDGVGQPKVAINGNDASDGVFLVSGSAFTWSSSDVYPYTNLDLGFARDAAGRLRVTDGSTGVGDALLGDLFLGGTTSSYPRITPSGTAAHIKLGDDSGFADLRVRDLTVDDEFFLGGATATDVKLTDNGGELYVKLGSDASYAPTTLGDLTVSSSLPELTIVEDDATTDEGKWRWEISNSVMSLLAVADDELSTSWFLNFTRTGNAVLGMTASVPITIQQTSPDYRWYKSDGATDEKLWQQFVNGDEMLFRSTSDNWGSVFDWLKVHRTAQIIDSVTFQAPVYVSGANLNVIGATAPYALVQNTGATTDEELWGTTVDTSGTWYLQSIEDDWGSTQNAISVARSGVSVGDVKLRGASGTLVKATGGEISFTIQDAANSLDLTDHDVDSVWVNKKGHTITITSIWCESNDSSPVINLQRDDGTPADIMSSDLTCSSSGASSSTFTSGEDAIADGSKIDFEYISGITPERITVNITYTE